jgi:energy-coupling factor transporter ATP-binding protein EcfA2
MMFQWCSKKALTVNIFARIICHTLTHQKKERHKMAIYTASARRNQGRQSFVIEFRHPLLNDNNGKRGRKVRKGLGTTDENEAKELEAQLNQILQNEFWHSITAENRARDEFDNRVVEIFYQDIRPSFNSHQELQEKYIPLPKEDYKSVLLMGVSGAGKTTLLRKLMGTDPKTERFPATSVNRTTTCETEVITNDSNTYQAVVTFLSEHETIFEIEQALLSAAERAIETDDEKRIAQELLESKDMRFRLKYLLGDWLNEETEDEEDDLFSEEESQEDLLDDDESNDISEKDKKDYFEFLQSVVQQIKNLSAQQRNQVELESGDFLKEVSSTDREALLELILEKIEQSKEFTNIADIIIDEVKRKFQLLNSGSFEKTTTGWIRAWHCSMENRQDFISAVKQFSGIHYKSWGRLITPLVNSIRIQGAFFPEFSDEKLPLVLIDTEGLGHKAGTQDSIPEQLTKRFIEVDSILLVDDATKAMMYSEKALEAIAACGQTQKLSVAFTHMDNVKGENLSSVSAKKEHIFNGLRNVLEVKVSNNIGHETAHAMREHLETNTFYLGFLDRGEDKKSQNKGDLPKLYQKTGFPIEKPVEMPLANLNIKGIELAIQAAAQEFRYKWRSLLGIYGLPRATNYSALHWATIKALTRRYAANWDIDSLYWSPTNDARTSFLNGLSRFLEDALIVEDIEKKNILANQIKAQLTPEITKLINKRLRENAQQQWGIAYRYSGTGSTHPRKIEIEGIYEKHIPIPQLPMSKEAKDLINDVENVLNEIITSINSLHRLD